MFEFSAFFIHPQTGLLYAAISYPQLQKGKDGFIRIAHGYKAMMSEDGEHWRDITAGDNIGEPTAIIADPENPGRVCYVVQGMRPYVAQSVDDAYSRWVYRRVDERLQKHPEQRGHNEGPSIMHLA